MDILNRLLPLLFILSTGFVLRVSSLCPNRCRCDEVKLAVDCKEAALDVVPITLNPSIAELYLSKNHIKTLSASFSFYRKLQFLDMSENGITQLGSRNFLSQSHLKVLLLGRNLISDLEKGSFSGLESLRILGLNENQLQEIPEKDVFRPLRSLEKLDLSGNSLVTLPKNAFHGLTSLKALHLSRNRLTVVPKQSLMSLGNLSLLDLSSNQLHSVLEDNTFPPSMTSLSDLSLDGNLISTIEDQAFAGVADSLRSLDLSFNRLEGIPSEALSLLAHLQKLSIGRNRISVIHESAFAGLRSLQDLVIKNDDHLKTIHFSALSHNPLLQNIAIEFCSNLHTLDADTFMFQRESLKSLSLRGNGLTSLDENLADWQSLEFADVRGNPFYCSCSLSWLYHLATSPNSSIKEQHLREILCHEPESLRGQELVSVSLMDQCSYEQSLSSYHYNNPLTLVVPIAILAFGATVFAIAVYFFVKRHRAHRSEARLKQYFADSDFNSCTHREKQPEATTVIPEYLYYNPYERICSESHYESVPAEPLFPTASTHVVQRNGVNYHRNNAILHQQHREVGDTPTSGSTNPYASSFVIQRPFKLDSNLYQL